MRMLGVLRVLGMLGVPRVLQLQRYAYKSDYTLQFVYFLANTCEIAHRCAKTHVGSAQPHIDIGALAALYAFTINSITLLAHSLYIAQT